jgi:hypothetical protein
MATAGPVIRDMDTVVAVAEEVFDLYLYLANSYRKLPRWTHWREYRASGE